MPQLRPCRFQVRRINACRRELEVDEIGPSLRYANAKVNRTQRSSGNGQTGGGFGNSNTATASPQDDPWATPQTTSGGSWGNGPDSEPPF